MELSGLIHISVEFDTGYDVKSRDYVSMEILEKNNILPVLNIVLTIRNPEDVLKALKASYITVKGTWNKNGETISMKTQIVDIQNSGHGATTKYTFVSQFYSERFLTEHSTKAYLQKTPDQVLSKLSELETDIKPLGSIGTFYRFNTSAWEFIRKDLLPNIHMDKGIPLITVSSMGKLVARNSAEDIGASISIGPGGKGVLEYRKAWVNYNFSKDLFIKSRTRASVKSHFTKSTYDADTTNNGVTDTGLRLDNGNLDGKQVTADLVNGKREASTAIVYLQFDPSYDNLKILDFIAIKSPDDVMSGKYYIVSMNTFITNKVTKTIGLRRLD